MEHLAIRTLGALKKSGYQPKSLKEELRSNLLLALQQKREVFHGILGYEHTVIPDLERAILSGHQINLLGLRGQAKTRLARMMTRLLDEWVPVLEGSELNEDPMLPLLEESRKRIEEHGDATPVVWMHRNERYVEKLATPDVSVADLIGDVDPIKASNLKIPYSDPRAIHFGLVPRSHRCIFVINELPDLQPRIQVALFNILQEGDVQIRGFKLRMPLDIQFVFTANPEDYTNRGSIVTPLKDRIGSQILTHYPKNIETSMAITRQEARLSQAQESSVKVPELLALLMESIAFQARLSEFVDQKSGVSARLSISVFENVVSAAERRMCIAGDGSTTVRIADLYAAIPAINGKIEMVYEGEQEGPYNVAVSLIIQAIKSVFGTYCPLEGKARKGDKKPLDPFREVVRWFGDGALLELPYELNEAAYANKLDQVPGLRDLAEKYFPGASGENAYPAMELILHGLASISRISRTQTDGSLQFADLIGSMLGSRPSGDDMEND
jgi:magnesium chelatase subunit I